MDLVTLFTFAMLIIGIGLIATVIVVIIGFVISMFIAAPESIIHRQNKFVGK